MSLRKRENNCAPFLILNRRFPEEGKKWGSFFAQGDASPPPGEVQGGGVAYPHPPCIRVCLKVTKYTQTS